MNTKPLRASAVVLLCVGCGGASVAPATATTTRSADVPAAPAAESKDETPSIDPRAMELLKRSAATLASLSTFAVHADATRDVLVHGDFKLQKTMTEDITVQKPSHMRAELNGDIGRRLFVYDGKSVTIFASPENTYATVGAPPTLSATLDALTRYDFDLPLTDLLYMATGSELGAHVKDAGLVGTSRVGDADCDHLAFRGEKVDWQVWIDQRDFLPKKLVITTRDEASGPQYEAVMRWNLAPKIQDASFTFTPPAGAMRMRLATKEGTATMGTK